MTLLELMLKEKIVWPIGAEFAVQDNDGEKVKFGRGRPPTLCGTGIWHRDVEMTNTPIHCLASDWASRIITREEYQAAGGWMKWEGDTCPVPKETPILYSTKMATAEPAKAGACRWENTGDDSDILAYCLTAIIPGRNLECQQEQDKMSNKSEVDNSWHERGELPPCGVPVELWFGGSFAYNCEFITRRRHHYVMWNLDADRPDAADYMNSEFLPLRTEREKVIEDMSRVMHEHDSVINDDTLGALYDAGYRKVKQ